MQLILLKPTTSACEADGDVNSPFCNTRALGAEYLAAADLALAGFNCFLAAAAMPFDLVVEVPTGLLRVQVKSTVGARSERNGVDHRSGQTIIRTGYIFDGRNHKNGRNGLNSYVGEADIFAFVALDLRRVMYARVGKTPNRVTIKADAFTEDACSLSLKTAIGAA